MGVEANLQAACANLSNQDRHLNLVVKTEGCKHAADDNKTWYIEVTTVLQQRPAIATNRQNYDVEAAAVLASPAHSDVPVVATATAIVPSAPPAPSSSSPSD